MCYFLYLICCTFCLILSFTQEITAKDVGKLRSHFVGGFDSSSFSIDQESAPEKLQLDFSSGNKKSVAIAGVYIKTTWDVNGKHHYERLTNGDPNGERLHIYWSGTQWIINYDLDPSRNFNNLMAYAKVRVVDPRKTSTHWHVKIGKMYEPLNDLHLAIPGELAKSAQSKSAIQIEEIFGVPKRLVPLFLAFMLDACAVGLVLPLLPFYIMELGANAFELSLVISSTSVAQMIGCVVMGKLNDKYGRRLHILGCLLGSFASLMCVSRATSIRGVVLARLIAVRPTTSTV